MMNLQPKVLPAELGSSSPLRLLHDSALIDQVLPIPGLQSQQYSHIRSGSQRIYNHAIRNGMQRRSYPGYSAPNQISTGIFVTTEKEKHVWTMTEDSGTSEESDSSLDHLLVRKPNCRLSTGAQHSVRTTRFESNKSAIDLSDTPETIISRIANSRPVQSFYQESLNCSDGISRSKLSSRRGVRRTFPGYVIPSRVMSRPPSRRRAPRLSNLLSFSIQSPIQSDIYLSSYDCTEDEDEDLRDNDFADQMKGMPVDISQLHLSGDKFAEERLPDASYRDDSAIALDDDNFESESEVYVKSERSPAYTWRPDTSLETSEEDCTVYGIESTVAIADNPSDEDCVSEGSDEEVINTNLSITFRMRRAQTNSPRGDHISANLQSTTSLAY
ncbi:hypothetical protein V1517DRAFT_321848 [Lipomyces orientalis]|uniref:Uncharacterized protein n=1 Tax=Lipomyces orientalis TaxID=1233043 RepID=A0ACC3TQ02_9ASCO